MPDATPAETLEHSRRLLRRLCTAAPLVVCSYPRVLDDAEQAPSELLDEYDAVACKPPADPGWHAAQLAGRERLVTTADRAPPIDKAEKLVGGASTIQAQLTEPVAAFIGGRLATRTLDEQASGLPALLRGNLIHDVGYTDSGTNASLDALVFCNEVIGMVKQFGKGINTDDEHLALDVISEKGVQLNEIERVEPFIASVQPVYDDFFRRYPQVPGSLVDEIRDEANP